MITILKLFAVAVYLKLVYRWVYAGWRALLKSQAEEIRDELEFEGNRARRQMIFNQHVQELSRYCLMRDYESITLGDRRCSD